MSHNLQGSLSHQLHIATSVAIQQEFVSYQADKSALIWDFGFHGESSCQPGRTVTCLTAALTGLGSLPLDLLLFLLPNPNPTRLVFPSVACLDCLIQAPFWLRGQLS